MKHGELIYATINRIDKQIFVQICMQHPYMIYCTWINPINGQIHSLISNYIWFDPKSKLESNEIKELPVYINPDNMKDYYIDISEINEHGIDF